jgi:hypothetical protein
MAAVEELPVDYCLRTAASTHGIRSKNESLHRMAHHQLYLELKAAVGIPQGFCLLRHFVQGPGKRLAGSDIPNRLHPL